MWLVALLAYSCEEESEVDKEAEAKKGGEGKELILTLFNS